MKRVVSLIVMLALVAMTVVVGPAMHDNVSAATTDQAHAHITEPSIGDVLAECCSVEDGKIHHASASCAMDCGGMLHWIPAPVVLTGAKLQFSESRQHTQSVFFTQLRPPISA